MQLGPLSLYFRPKPRLNRPAVSFLPIDDNPKDPDHIGRVEERGFHVVIGSPFDAHRGGLRIDHRIGCYAARRDSDLGEHLPHGDHGTLDQPALFQGGTAPPGARQLGLL
jgi:hypothetical protein